MHPGTKGMYKEIVINADPSETRIAVLEDARLVELFVEREEERRLVGDIYKGAVNAVLPGIQAAFLDVGLSRTAFLHASDMLESMIDIEGFDIDEAERRHETPRQDLNIQDHLHKGQEVMVQVIKEPIGTKGPKVSCRLSLPGRYLVLMPGLNHIGVSRKIVDRSERQRLKALLQELRPMHAGLICRTAADGRTRKELEADVEYLISLWKEIEENAASTEAPAVIHREMELTTGLIRDLFNEDVSRLTIDSRQAYKQIVSYLKAFSPEMKNRVKLYKGDGPIFDEYGIEAEIEKTLDRKVWLKKGGYIIIDHTEALVAVDVNTGRYTGKKNQEDTILKTNLEAAEEIARQLRLRDLGGIIVCDFIDMEEETSKRQVLETFRSALRRDRARTKIFPISELGLIEMTRQRERESLFHYFSDDCPTCGGSGKVLSLRSMALKVDRALRRVGAHTKEKLVQLRIHPDMATHLFDRSEHMEELEKKLGIRVDIREDPRMRRDDLRVLFPRLKKDVTEEFGT
jgi:ribonuclease G